MSFYAIEDGTHTPKRYVQTINKLTPASYAFTTVANDVLEYTSQSTAQADADFCDNHFGERFHVGASPKPH